MARRRSTSIIITRVLALVLLVVGGWYLWTADWPWSPMPAEQLVHEKGVYTGQPDRPLEASTVQTLQQRATTQSF